MEALVTIKEQDGRKAVSARELYEKLGFDTSQWARWYKKNIIDNEFAVEQEDYVGFDIMSNGNLTKDFAISLDFAKRICMLARTEAGEKIRNYFIEMEKVATSLSTLDILELTIKGLREQKKELDEIKDDVRLLKAATQTRPDYFTIVGWATINKMQIGLQVAARLGIKAAKICRDAGYLMDEIPDPRFGRVRMYPRTVLQQVFDQPI